MIRRSNYRPSKFSEVIGQESVVQTLVNTVKMGNPVSGYLLSGMYGVGKTTLLRIFAKAINCLEEGVEPCGRCSSCKSIENGSSMDVIEIDGASNRGIDNIREITNSIQYATFESKYKIFIVDEAHMLTKEAFNALLKPLEEPSPCTLFFFATTELHKVIPTVISRCQVLELLRLSNKEIIGKLQKIAKDKKISISKEAIELIADMGKGSLRDAESIFDRIFSFKNGSISVDDIYTCFGLVDKKYIFEVDNAYGNGDLAFPITFSKKLFASGKDLNLFVEILFDHYRNIALVLMEKREIEGYQDKYKIYSLEQVLHIVDYLCKISLEVTTFTKVYLEMVLTYIIQSKNRVSLKQLMGIVKNISNNSGKNVDKPEISTPGVSAQNVDKPEISTPEVGTKKDRIDMLAKPRMENLFSFASVEFNGSTKN